MTLTNASRPAQGLLAVQGVIHFVEEHLHEPLPMKLFQTVVTGLILCDRPERLNRIDRR